MITDHHKAASLYHSLLALNQKVTAGTEKGNSALFGLLTIHHSLEGIFEHYFPEPTLFPNPAPLPRPRGIDRLVKLYESLPFDFKAVTIRDPGYPAALSRVHGAPPVLYVRGDLGLLSLPAIAVVGTRRLEHPKDIEEAACLVARAVSLGYVIVSGLASGCDTLAHKVCIENRGKTIAVLGTPLDKSYPKENQDLQDVIANNHLIISQYPIGIPTYPSYFAHRNVTTVGLATEGVLVVHADDRSGTMHAVRHCVLQRKPLFALKRNLEARYSWTRTHQGKILVPGPEWLE